MYHLEFYSPPCARDLFQDMLAVRYWTFSAGSGYIQVFSGFEVSGFATLVF